MTKKVDGFIGAGDGVFAESFYCEFEMDKADLCAILLDVKLPNGSEESRRYVQERTCKVTYPSSDENANEHCGNCSECGFPWIDVRYELYCGGCGAKVVDE